MHFLKSVLFWKTSRTTDWKCKCSETIYGFEFQCLRSDNKDHTVLLISPRGLFLSSYILCKYCRLSDVMQLGQQLPLNGFQHEFPSINCEACVVPQLFFCFYICLWERFSSSNQRRLYDIAKETDYSLYFFYNI